MSSSAQWQVERLDEAVDHVRGPTGAQVVLVYGDYECPYTRRAYGNIQRVEAELGGAMRFAFRHFPLTRIHPHAMAASLAAEAAAVQGGFWEMNDALFHHQRALEDGDLRGYAGELGFDLGRFDSDRHSEVALERITRDVHSGEVSGLVLRTPTLFIDGALHEGSYDVASLLEALG